MQSLLSRGVRGLVGSLLLLAAPCLFAVGLAGCGGGSTDEEAGPTGTVSGAVTYQSKPVTAGKIQFYSTETGKSGMAELGEAGKYMLTDPLPAGKYKVSILPPDEQAPTSEAPVAMTVHSNIPEKYRNELTTDLEAVVKEGENTFPFDMK